MLEIYKDFELITVEPSYANFKWRRQFSRAGEFQLETFFSPEKMTLFVPGNIIYKRNVDEAAIIERRSIIQNIDGDLVMFIHGRMLLSLLDRRIFTMEGTYGLKSFLTTVINGNFLTGASNNRRVINMQLLPMDFPDITVKAEFKQQNIYETITKILEDNNIGAKIFYNIKNKTYDLLFYSSIETDVAFSREFANIIEQDYTDDTEQYKNVVYVEEVYTHNDSLYKGLERREMAISKPTEGENVTQNAINALMENKSIRTLSNVINPFGKQYEYLKDWDIGSIVTAISVQLEYTERELVTEITEFYDETGLNLEVNLGDYKVRG